MSPLERGPYQGHGIIGDVTEAVHAWLHEGWPAGRPPPRIVEDLAFDPKDREDVVYVAMYRVAQNTALLNPKRWRQANVQPHAEGDRTLWARPPLYLDLYYLVAAHARFRSDAERLLGWTLLRLAEATHLVHRPRRYVLPDGREVDSAGRPWSREADGDLIMEKVSLALVDDLALGEAVHFFRAHDAPYRPYVTWRARCAMEGSLVEAPPTVVRPLPVRPLVAAPPSPRAGRAPLERRAPIGPAGAPPAPFTPEE